MPESARPPITSATLSPHPGGRTTAALPRRSDDTNSSSSTASRPIVWRQSNNRSVNQETSMPDVDIDRLILQVPGLSAGQGQRLAELVVAALERARFSPSAPASHVAVELASSGGSLEQPAA